MKTEKQWNESGEIFHDFCQPWNEVDRDIYDYFLGVIPPAAMANGSFLVGEPARHNSQGEGVFAGFCHLGNKYYYMGEMTRSEFYNGPPKEQKQEMMKQIETALS